MASSLLKANSRGSENLTDANISKVIKLLEAEKPCTKKLACELLGIAYNVTRLATIIQTYKDKKESDKRRRLAKRGTDLSNDEIGIIASEYMEGKDLKSIADLLARSLPKIKWALEFYGIPKRGKGEYLKPELVPDTAMRTQFAVGEKVWSTRYESLAEVYKEIAHPDEKVYRLWLLDEGQNQFCYQPASELCSLQHLTDLGIKL